jgi:hypothetical protein
LKRKIATLFIFLTSAALLILAMNQAFINKLKQDRYFAHLRTTGTPENTLYQRVFIRSDRWAYGDLYGLCYLPQYKLRLEPFECYEKQGGETASGRVVYLIGDSYLADKTMGAAFKGFDEVIFLDRRFPFGPVSLDSTKQNVLIMEFAERNLVDYEIRLTPENRWTETEIVHRSSFRPPTTKRGNSCLPTGFAERLNKILFNSNLSRNLELLLFDDKIFTSVKETKAWLNNLFFGRLPREVALSSDKKRLLMNITVDTVFRQSDFRMIPDVEIVNLVRHLKEAKDYYLSIGFKKVYLSVIPNAVSVYDSNRMPYNHLLERVEKNNLFPVISVYRSFKDNHRNLYYRSDTHWNPVGFGIWIKKTDSVLNSQ